MLICRRSLDGLTSVWRIHLEGTVATGALDKNVLRTGSGSRMSNFESVHLRLCLWTQNSGHAPALLALQFAILSNHLGGKDAQMRQMRLYSAKS